jgi:hypothetical protein
VNTECPKASPVRPLISEERMKEILAARKPIPTDECYRQIEQHLGRPMQRARKPVIIHGETVWVSC